MGMFYISILSYQDKWDQSGISRQENMYFSKLPWDVPICERIAVRFDNSNRLGSSPTKKAHEIESWIEDFL
jgi:hypothetical protein